MEKSIQNIGKLNYVLTILFGKNREVREIVIGDEDMSLKGDYIITIGKKAVILTKQENGKRELIIVKKWKQYKSSGDVFMNALNQSSNDDTKRYKDADGMKWEYNNSNLSGDEWLTVYSENGDMMYEIVLR